MIWEVLVPNVTLFQACGYLPDFLSEDEPESAKEQFDRKYRWGGWAEFKGFTKGEDHSLSYPGDPIKHPIARTTLHGELVLVYPGAWVCIVHKDGTFSTARLD